MANIPLKSIKFPGLADTYTVPQIDSTLAVTGKAADAKATGDRLSAILNAFNALGLYVDDEGYLCQRISTDAE